jgi:hypothetical protein
VCVSHMFLCVVVYSGKIPHSALSEERTDGKPSPSWQGLTA